ncbi:MAG: hypothetical protein MJ211_04165 [Bacteroidales bacterium]|nr:hypothetical protein [Bacteroidales bacterium]
MKYLSSIFSAIICTIFFVSCQPSAEQVKTSAESLNNIYKSVLEKYAELENSYELCYAETMDNALANLNSEIAKATEELNKFQMVSGCEPLFNAVKSSIEVYKSIAEKDSKEQVRMYKVPDEEFTEELRNSWDQIAKSVETRTKDANASVEKAYNEVSKLFTTAK